MTEEEKLAAEFERHRPYLHAIAFRVLGSHADADDAVQEAWLRLARAGGGSIQDLRGWLTIVTGRICLDLLRRRGTRATNRLRRASGRAGPSRGWRALPGPSAGSGPAAPSRRRPGARSRPGHSVPGKPSGLEIVVPHPTGEHDLEGGLPELEIRHGCRIGYQPDR